MSSKWKIQKFRPTSKNTLKGTFKLLIGDLSIDGCMLHEKAGKKLVAFPAAEYTKNGSLMYRYIINFRSKKLKNQFRQWAVAECERIQKKLK